MTYTTRSYETFKTNIKGLPEGEYMTQTMHSDAHPWKVVGHSPSGKTLTLQAVKTKPDPEWKPNILQGGFSGHCTNQDAQTWIYAGLSDTTCTVRLRKSRYHGSDKLWASPSAGEFIANGAVERYDYNF